MSFRTVVMILRRRWYAAVAVLLVVAGLSWPIDHPKPEYQALAVLVLTPPKVPAAPNSLAATTPSIAAAGLAVDDVLQSPAQTQALREAGVTDSFTIAPRNSGTNETPAYTIPSEQLTVTGSDPNTATREIAELISAFETNLQSMQARVGVTPRDEITAGVLAQTSVAELRGVKTRGLLGMGLLGIGFAIALPLWLDRRLGRWVRSAQSGGRSGLGVRLRRGGRDGRAGGGGSAGTGVGPGVPELS